MPNMNLDISNFEAIVDDRGNILGIVGPSGNPTYFSRAAASTGVARAITGTSQQQIFAGTVPGGSLGPNGFLRLSGQISCTNNANAKTLGLYIGGTLITTFALASMAGFAFDIFVRARGNRNSQVVQGNVLGNSATLTSAIDMSLEQLVELRMTQATGTDTTTLEGCSLEIVPAT